MATKIMIDSASDINNQEAQKLGLHLVPIEVRFGDEEYLDGFNLMPEEFYDKLVKSAELPKTSLINQFRWEEEFAKATEDGDDVVVVTLSSRLSGTYNSAVEAAKKFEGKVHVVDSLNAATGERILGLYALDLVGQGKSATEIADILNKIKGNIRVMAVVNTLKYLKKGGRVSATVAFAGEMLSIKPIVAVVDGEVKMAGKAMGLKKATATLTSMINQTAGIDFDKPLGLIYSGNDISMVEAYKKDIEPIWKPNVQDITPYTLGSTIGTHVGPGAVGIAFFEK